MNFSFDNIQKVARWDLAINRSFYKRTLMALLVATGIVSFFHLIPHLWKAMMYGTSSISAEDFRNDGMVNSFFISMCLFAFLLLPGTTFRTLAKKQGRLNEFLMPASNLERYIWRVFATLTSSLLAIVVSVAFYDLLHWIVYTVTFSGIEVKSAWCSLSFTIDDYDNMRLTLGSGYAFWVEYNVYLLFFAFSTTYLLGSSIRYKKSVLWTTLFHFCLFLLFIAFLCMVAVSMENHGLLERILNALFNKNDILSWLENYPWVAPFSFALPFTLLVVWMWRKSYKLYCRAQLTTRMNP